MGAPQKIEIPTQEISREAFFDLKHTKTSAWENACKTVGRFTQRFNPFPFPGATRFRLATLTDSPSRGFVKHAAIGLAIGLVFGGAWRYWHQNVYNVRRDDFYKQLAKANAEEVEKFRLRLVDEGKQRRADA